VSDRNSAPGAVGDAPIINSDEDSEDITVDLRLLFSDPDGDELTFEIASDPVLQTHVDRDGILHVTPKRDWAGTAYVTVTTSDGRSIYQMTIPITVRNVNDPPSITEMVVPSQVMEGDLIVLWANSTDPDLPYGDALDHQWSMAGRGELGRGREISFRIGPGVYDIILRITDDSGASETRNATLTVEAVLVDGPGGDPWWSAVVVAGIVALVLASAVAILFILKKRGNREEWVIEDDEPTSVTHRSHPGGDLLSRIEAEGDPEMTDALMTALEYDGRIGLYGIRNTIKTMYADDALDAKEYGELISVLDRIEE
jgi:hypothetical protein